MYGRRRQIPELKARNWGVRSSGERLAVNTPIQGTAADIIKRAMARMSPALAAAGLGSTRMLLQVHDELVFEVPEADVEAATEIVRDVMASAAEPAIQLSVPLGVEIGTGPNWGAAH
jgi:DNA polymerase-1